MTAPQVTELIIVRHGETRWNLENRLQGHQDSPLTDLGREQAAAVAKRVVPLNFAALYSSDLGRAVQTAEMIAERTGHRIVVEPRLRECNLGLLEGRTTAEIVRDYPQFYDRCKSGDPDYAVPEGESRRQMYERVTACAAELVARHPGQQVVAVTHGGVLDCLFRFVIGLPPTAPRNCRLFNGSLNTFQYEAGQWCLATWGDTCHLRVSRYLKDY